MAALYYYNGEPFEIEYASGVMTIRGSKGHVAVLRVRRTDGDEAYVVSVDGGHEFHSAHNPSQAVRDACNHILDARERGAGRQLQERLDEFYEMLDRSSA